MINLWDNPQNYKPCKKKQYELWVCKPPKGTVVINKLEHTDAYQFAGGHSFFTSRQVKADPKIAAGVQQLLQIGKAYLVKDDQTFALCGTQGELWCISAQALAQKYVWASDDGRINKASFEQRAHYKSYNLPNAQTRVEHWDLQWTKVRTVPDNSPAFACFVPANMLGQIPTSLAILNINYPGVNHGKGDFVIAGSIGGQPNLNDRHVVNGVVFGATYDNRGWSDYITPYKTVQSFDELPNLFKGAEYYEHNLNFDTESVFRRFKEAASILDKNGYVIKEVECISGRPEPEARELAARLNSEDFACIRVNNDNCCYDDIYVLFPDMSVYPVEARNVSNPFGSVDSKRVLSSKSDVKVLFDKCNISHVLMTAHAQEKAQARAQVGFQEKAQERVQMTIDFVDRQKFFEMFKKAESITDSERLVAKEAKYQATHTDKALAKELNTRLDSEDFACMDEMTDYSNLIYVLFPDMTVYFVEGRTSADPYGSVYDKKVLCTQIEVKAFFDKFDIENILRTAQEQEKAKKTWWARIRG